LAIFAIAEVCLSATQVVASFGEGGTGFGKASYGFAVANLFMAAVTNCSRDWCVGSFVRLPFGYCL
jgi:hypothetical protein